MTSDPDTPRSELGEVAESNRRGENAADDELDDVLDDAVDDDADEPVSRGGGTATRSRRKADTEAETVDKEPSKRLRTKKDGTPRVGIFARIGRFVREVIGELRKVIWPSRNDLLTYTAVVVAFLTVVVALVVSLDYGFAKLALLVFGN